MQQSDKKWIIIVSILLAAVLFVLFIPYGKDGAVYRLTKKYISRYYSEVVVCRCQRRNRRSKQRLRMAPP